ncbi:MAG: YceD family protein [Solirubrobacteraceae bacterium]
MLRTDTFDLSGLHLGSGQGRRLELAVSFDPFELAGECYAVAPELVPACLDVSRTTGDGYALRLRLEAELTGPCMRCLGAASPSFEVDAREISLPREGDELESPYVSQSTPVLLDLRGWARDATALALPTQLLCRPDCAGLCPVCGADLNLAGPDHAHQREPDPRWAKLSELHFD